MNHYYEKLFAKLQGDGNRDNRPHFLKETGTTEIMINRVDSINYFDYIKKVR